MALPLERTGDRDPVQRNFDKLKRLVLDTGGVSAGIRFGGGTLTFSASTDSATVTISHGLGATPIAVTANSLGAPGFTKIPLIDIAAVDDDSFDARGELGAAHTGDIIFTWIAVG